MKNETLVFAPNNPFMTKQNRFRK